MVDVDQITKLVKRHFKINGNFQVNPQTGEVDVQGDVIYKGLTTSQGMFHVQFGTVSGDFDCANKNAISLIGSPHTVGGNFFCQGSLLGSMPSITSLQGAPRIVHGGFSCMHNLLTNLEGAPEQVGKWFSCDNNLLTNLQGSPTTVGGSFSCYGNKLKSLEGGPTHVHGFIYMCKKNPLKSLQGLPLQMADIFQCSYSKNLPLLRLLTLSEVRLDLQNAPKRLLDILNNHMGKGKSSALNCALEMKKAGYEGNARW